MRFDYLWFRVLRLFGWLFVVDYYGDRRWLCSLLMPSYDVAWVVCFALVAGVWLWYVTVLMLMCLFCFAVFVCFLFVLCDWFAGLWFFVFIDLILSWIDCAMLGFDSTYWLWFGFLCLIGLLFQCTILVVLDYSLVLAFACWFDWFRNDFVACLFLKCLLVGWIAFGLLTCYVLLCFWLALGLGLVISFIFTLNVLVLDMLGFDLLESFAFIEFGMCFGLRDLGCT